MEVVAGQLQRSQCGAGKLPNGLGTWDTFAEDDNCIELLTMEGKAILRYQHLEVSRKISAWGRSPLFTEIGGYTVPVMNCTSLISEICGELSWGHPFAAMHIDVNGKRFYSLRACEGDVDCGLVARQYGGGGHTGAVGYSVDL